LFGRRVGAGESKAVELQKKGSKEKDPSSEKETACEKTKVTWAKSNWGAGKGSNGISGGKRLGVPLSQGEKLNQRKP